MRPLIRNQIFKPTDTRGQTAGLATGLPELKVSRNAWFVLWFSVIATVIAFLVLDPNPDLLLAFCAGANVGIILSAIYQLYAWDLLLSPMSTVLVTPGWLIYYSIGNLGARMSGENRFGSNLGSLEYYPMVALLASLGLLLFCGVIFGLLRRWMQMRGFRYQDFVWQPWQAVASTAMAIVVFLYLSERYNFTGGYFRDISNIFDQWLSYSNYIFVTAAALISISVLAKAQGRPVRLGAITCIVILLSIALGLRSRTFMISLVILLGLCWITLRPHHIRPALLAGIVIGVLLFTLGTVVKVFSTRGDTVSIIDNLALFEMVTLEDLQTYNLASAQLDYQYRLAGFEYPAILIRILNMNVEPMYGTAFLHGFLQGIPAQLRPAGNYSERLAIYQHYRYYGLVYGDTIGIPLTSGIADWGIVLGPLIYIVIALFCAMAWQFFQSSPRLMLAFLASGATVGDLFWENAMSSIRVVGFAWLYFLILGFILMPVHVESPHY